MGRAHGIRELTQPDFIILALLLISAGIGFTRGAVREIVALVAFVVAAITAVLCLSITGPMGREWINPDWLGALAALVLTFGVIYILLRLLGAALSRRLHATKVLGLLDRSVGLALGLGRGLVVLGALFLIFSAATPKYLQPRWITEASTWPLASNMGRLLQALAPRGLRAAGRLKPVFDRAVREASGDISSTDGYDANQPSDIEDLAEKSR